MKHFRFLIVFLLTIASGCSQYIKDTGSTIKEAFTGLPDTVVSAEKVTSLPYASIYARVNNGPRVFMVLAFIEPNSSTGSMRLKWLSSDGAMIATENGRIVKTLLLPSYNLLNFSGSSPQHVSGLESTSWPASYDWQPGYHFNQQASIQSNVIGQELITSLIWQKATQKIAETVTVSNTNKTYQNIFWIDQQGIAVKSKQWAIPEHLMVELEVLKPYKG